MKKIIKWLAGDFKIGRFIVILLLLFWIGIIIRLYNFSEILGRILGR